MWALQEREYNGTNTERKQQMERSPLNLLNLHNFIKSDWPYVCCNEYNGPIKHSGLMLESWI